MENYVEMLVRVKKTATYITETAGKKGVQALAISKAKMKIVELKAEIDYLYRDIGKLVYESQNGSEISEVSIILKVEEIDEKVSEIKELEEVSSKIKGAVICLNCQTISDIADENCRNCGFKL